MSKMSEFSRSWNKSKQPRKQRKYRYNAPLHILRRFMGVHLSPELRKKYGKRSISLKKGDTVKVLRGKFKGRTGKVERNDIKNTKVYIEGIEITKKDGSKTSPPIHPSNLLITALEIDDKKRKARLVTK